MALDGGLGLASAALTALGGRLVVAALAELAPFGEVVGALLLHVGLAVFARDSGNVLFDGILDSDVPDLFVQRRQRIGPRKKVNRSSTNDTTRSPERLTIPWEEPL